MSERRITSHPILPPLGGERIGFTFDGRPLEARKGEVISSALYAAGISVFGHHRKDGGAQSIFCVNGQCSQCTVVADGRPVKSCMTPVREGMAVTSCDGLPAIGDSTQTATRYGVEDVAIQVLVVGGGPAGISAAVELGRLGIGVLVVDDKQELGGKLSLQTHNFFGSVADCYAGVRGIDIGHTLADEIERLPTVKVWLDATVVGVYRDGKFGVACTGQYRLVTPEVVLVACGAREKSLSFPGSDLPGVYGAGAFQTLVNRDQVRCAERLFVVGGGNVGLIGAYHALQAGIDVVGLVEALPRCGGYKVHEDKIRRLGVPVWTAHTVLRAEGEEAVERVVTAAVDERFQPVAGSERSFEVDTVLIAVGLAPVDELLHKAQQFGMRVYAAGDTVEIAEASAAIFSGRITGRTMARDLGMEVPIPADWGPLAEMLKHRPGEAEPFVAADQRAPVYPLIRCVQEIPCDPCTAACPHGLISMEGSILSLPRYSADCVGCGRCVLACPGLAIQLVVDDYDPSRRKALVMLPFELPDEALPLGREVTTTGMEGEVVGKGRVVAVRDREDQDRRRLLLLEVPAGDKLAVAGFRVREPEEGVPALAQAEHEADPIICRCERVRLSEIVAAIRAGVRDMNQLKAVARSGMGGCGGKTCTEQVLRIFRAEGVDAAEVTLPTHRPLVAEVHLGDFVASAAPGEDDYEMSAGGPIFDVIVVGAGSVGNPTAFFLAEAGLSVLVLERRPASGQGDNKAAIGGVRATHSDPGKILTCSESLAVFSTWQERYGFDIGWKEGGYCFPVYDEPIRAVLAGILPVQKAHGLDIDWVGPERVAELVPGIVVDGLLGGTYSPHDGQVSPLRAAVAFQIEATRRGATYRFGERVVGYVRASGRVAGVVTDAGATYAAGYVVLAAGADAGEHGEMLGIDIPVTPDSHEAGITAPVEPFLDPLVVDLRPGPEGKTANFYFGQNKEGQIIFCYTPKELFVGTDRESTSEFLPILANRMISLVPRFENLLIRRIWRGCYPMTPDGIPIIDWAPGMDGLVLAVGMCGQGFMMGPGVARNVTSLIVAGEPLLPRSVHAAFRYDRDFYAAKKEALK